MVYVHVIAFPIGIFHIPPNLWYIIPYHKVSFEDYTPNLACPKFVFHPSFIEAYLENQNFKPKSWS